MGDWWNKFLFLTMFEKVCPDEFTAWGSPGVSFFDEPEKIAPKKKK